MLGASHCIYGDSHEFFGKSNENYRISHEICGKSNEHDRMYRIIMDNHGSLVSLGDTNLQNDKYDKVSLVVEKNTNNWLVSPCFPNWNRPPGDFRDFKEEPPTSHKPKCLSAPRKTSQLVDLGVSDFLDIPRDPSGEATHRMHQGPVSSNGCAAHPFDVPTPLLLPCSSGRMSHAAKPKNGTCPPWHPLLFRLLKCRCRNALFKTGRRFEKLPTPQTRPKASGFLLPGYKAPSRPRSFSEHVPAMPKDGNIPSRAEWMLKAARETTQESMIFIISLLGVYWPRPDSHWPKSTSMNTFDYLLDLLCIANQLLTLLTQIKGAAGPYFPWFALDITQYCQ